MQLSPVQDQAIAARMALIVGSATFDRLFTGARFPALLAQSHRSRVLALFFWRRVAVGLLPCRYIDNRLGELVGVPGVFGLALMTRSAAFALPFGERPCLHGFVCRWFWAFVGHGPNMTLRGRHSSQLNGLARCSARLDIDCLGGLYGLSGLLDREMQHTLVEMSVDGSVLRLERQEHRSVE